MRKKIVMLGILIVALTFFFSSEWGLSHNRKKVCPVIYCVNDILVSKSISKCDIVKIGDYKKANLHSYKDAVCAEEIDEYIDNMLSSYTKRIEIKSRSNVRLGDLISIDYYAYYKGKIINSNYDQVINVGNGEFNSEIEAKLVGAKVNSPVEVKLKISDDCENNEQVGKIDLIRINVTSIFKYKTYKLTNDFVKENFQVTDVKKYKEGVKNLLLKQKKEMASRKNEGYIMQSIINKSCFSLDETSIAHNAVNIVDSYKKLAINCNMDLVDYIKKELKMSEDEFYNKCYSESEDEIKYYLVIGAIAKKEKILISKKEVESYCKDNGFSQNDLNDEQTLDYQGFVMTEKKVLDLIIKNAVQVK